MGSGDEFLKNLRTSTDPDIKALTREMADTKKF